MHIGLWMESLLECDHCEDLDMSRRIILKRILHGTGWYGLY
jgi:hypothetical protein